MFDVSPYLLLFSFCIHGSNCGGGSSSSSDELPPRLYCNVTCRSLQLHCCSYQELAKTRLYYLRLVLRSLVFDPDFAAVAIICLAVTGGESSKFRLLFGDSMLFESLNLEEIDPLKLCGLLTLLGLRLYNMSL